MIFPKGIYCVIFHNQRYATRACRRPIRMSLLCQIDMTLPRIFREVPGMTVRLMSDRALARLEVLRDLDHGRLIAPVAAQLPGLESPYLCTCPLTALAC